MHITTEETFLCRYTSDSWRQSPDPGFNTMPGFYTSEGFARLTRNGKTDISLIQNRSPLVAYLLSLAYEFDYFQRQNRSLKTPLIIKGLNTVESLGGVLLPYGKQRWMSIPIRCLV